MQLSQTELLLKEEIISKLQRHFGKKLIDATNNMIYKACALTVRDKIMEKWAASHQQVKSEKSKKLYYMSLEFLMGRSLGTNILNLMLTDEYKNVFANLGVKMPAIEEQEHDAGLGNGGLGRLAACFLDSLTTMDLPAYGCSIRYEYGLFKQRIVDGYQIEMPDPWLEDGSIWEIARPEEQVEVKFGGIVKTIYNEGRFSFQYENSHAVLAVPYDVPICGYDSSVINKLRLWSARSPKHFDMALFNHGNYARSVEEREMAEMISNVLYPEDNHLQGKTLRLRQQYFLVSATVQWILKEFKKRYGTEWSKLPQKAAIQLNDTHPTLAIPELMRILMDDEHLGWDDAWKIVTSIFAYTNHSVLAEAMERWPIDLMQPLLPRIFMIIEEIHRRQTAWLDKIYPNDPQKLEYMAVIQHNSVNMTNLCMASCYAINGVSALHTKILTTQTFADYYKIDPHRFHSITNGVTFRRWIVDANPDLTELINSKIGNSWIKDSAKLVALKEFCEDQQFVKQFGTIKYNNKIVLANFIERTTGIQIDPNSIFDVQIKRLHEYKRQLLNVLHIMYLYNQVLDNPDMDFVPRTFIFGAKAAPGYARAKLIIKLINSVGELINNDARINGKIKVVFIENYGVTLAEMIVAAADVSEQISTAGKEASGTGNMKLMLNGALTMGTLDGANIEILEQVGSENIYIFGMKTQEVNARYNLGSDDIHAIYSSDAALRRVLEQLVDGTIDPQKPNLFNDIYQSLLFGDQGFADPYMVLRDFAAYVKAQQQLSVDYKDRQKWFRMAIHNTASAGFFSSDRTIAQYNSQIWHLVEVRGQTSGGK